MQRQKDSSKVSIKTGLMFALICLIIISTSYIPMLLDIGIFILPIPITVLYVLHNFKVSLTSILIGIVLTAIIYNPLLAITSGISYGLTGLTLGYCIKKNKNSGKSIVNTGIATILGNGIRFLIYTLIINKQGIYEILTKFTTDLKAPFIEAKDIYISMNAPKEIVYTMNQCISFITVNNVLMIIPVIIFINSFIQSYINYCITEKTIKKLGEKVNNIVPFRRIYISNRVVALFIIIECMGIILNSKGVRGTYYVANMGHLIISFALTIDGIAYFAYLLREKFKKSKAMTFIILVIIMLIPIFANLYFLFGIIDILFNLRKLDPDPIRKPKSRE